MKPERIPDSSHTSHPWSYQMGQRILTPVIYSAIKQQHCNNKHRMLLLPSHPCLHPGSTVAITKVFHWISTCVLEFVFGSSLTFSCSLLCEPSDSRRNAQHQERWNETLPWGWAYRPYEPLPIPSFLLGVTEKILWFHPSARTWESPFRSKKVNIT